MVDEHVACINSSKLMEYVCLSVPPYRSTLLANRKVEGAEERIRQITEGIGWAVSSRNTGVVECINRFAKHKQD